MLKIVLLLGVAAYASAKIATIGPCTAKVQALKIDFDEYSTANHGVWKFSKVTDTPKNSQYKSLKAVSTPTGTSGVYDVVLKYKDNAGKTGIFANETLYGNDCSFIVAKGKDFDYTLKIFFLKYTPGEYGYYYICSDDGGDTAHDYRYVVSNKKLSKDQTTEINNLDKEFKFKGQLVDI